MANSDITLGAQIRAIGNAVGMSEDQVIQMVIGAQRKGGRQLGREIGNDEAQAAVLRRLQKVAGVNEEMPGDIDQYRSVPNDQVAVGEEGNQDRLQNFGGRKEGGGIKNVDQQLAEMAGAEGRVDPNVIKRTKWDKELKQFVPDGEFYAADGVPIPAGFQDAAKQKDFGLQVPNQFGPAQQVLRGELERLQAGIDKYGAEAFPGGIDPQRGVSRDVPGVFRNEFVDPLRPGVQGPNAEGARLGQPYTAQIPGAAGVAGRIEDDLYGAGGAEQALAREMVARDNANVNPEVVEANNYRAQAEANILGQAFQQGGPGARADEAMERIGRINNIGHYKIGNDFSVSNNAVDREVGMPNDLPLNLPDQYNAPITDNRFAGPLQAQEQWLADNAPDYTVRGDQPVYQQIDIGGQLGAAQRGIEGINFRGQNVNLGERGIRNLDDLQGAVDQAVALGQQQGVRFFNFQDGKNNFVANPGINEVLQKAGMNANQQNDLARAMFAVEAANRNPANASNKARFKKGKEQPQGQNMGGRKLVRIQGANGKEYRVVREPNRVVDFGGNAPAVGGGMVQIAKLGGEKIEGKEVRGQLQALTGRAGNDTPLNVGELADARMPLIGGVAGNDIPRAAFVRGEDVNMTDGQRIEKYGPVNGEVANRVVRRFNEAGGYGGKSTPRLVESQMSTTPGYPDNTIDTEQAIAAQKAKRTQQSLAGITYNEQAPDPWSQEVGTGPGFTQVSKSTPGTRPQLALPYGVQTSGATQGPTRPLTNELKNELAALSSGYSEQGPRPSANFSDPGIRADGPNVSPRKIRQEADYRQSVRNLGRVRGIGRNSAIVGGAVAGLAGIDGLINGERNKREEAQY